MRSGPCGWCRFTGPFGLYTEWQVSVNMVKYRGHFGHSQCGKLGKAREAPPASLLLRGAVPVHFLAAILDNAYQLLGVCLGFHFWTPKAEVEAQTNGP
jgi:hypothetical protein